jgi:hypothetical protein
MILEKRSVKKLARYTKVGGHLPLYIILESNRPTGVRVPTSRENRQHHKSGDLVGAIAVQVGNPLG